MTEKIRSEIRIFFNRDNSTIGIMDYTKPQGTGRSVAEKEQENKDKREGVSK